MSTTFSGRIDEADLAFANAVTRDRFGISFGQYCGSILIDAIRRGEELPQARRSGDNPQSQAVVRMKELSTLPHDEAIGRLSDDELRDLRARRYA